MSEASGAFQIPEIPQAVWTAKDSPAAMSALVPWLNDWPEAPQDKRSLLGAVLAARESDPADPQAYVERCLESGVKPKWINRAQKLINGRQP